MEVGCDWYCDIWSRNRGFGPCICFESHSDIHGKREKKADRCKNERKILIKREAIKQIGRGDYETYKKNIHTSTNFISYSDWLPEK